MHLRASVSVEELERAILPAIGDHVLSDDNREQLRRAAQSLFAPDRAPRIESQQLQDVRWRIEKPERKLALADHAEDFTAIAAQLREWRKREQELAEWLPSVEAETSESAERMELIENLATLRNHPHLADRVLLAGALRETIVHVSVGRETMTVKHFTRQMTFAPLGFHAGD